MGYLLGEEGTELLLVLAPPPPLRDLPPSPASSPLCRLLHHCPAEPARFTGFKAGVHNWAAGGGAAGGGLGDDLYVDISAHVFADRSN